MSVSITPNNLLAEPLFANRITHDLLKDNDKDSVINVRDKCPDTQTKAEVDNDGCQKSAQTLRFEDLKILFNTDSDVVRPRYYKSLKNLADFMHANPASRIVIEGHSDNIGSNQANLTLPLNRANAIAARLVNHFHIERSRIQALGDSEHKPIENKDTAKEKHQNQRSIVATAIQTKVDSYKWNIYNVDTLK